LVDLFELTVPFPGKGINI